MADDGGRGVRIAWSRDLAHAALRGFGLTVLAQATLPAPMGYVALLGRSAESPQPAISLACSLSLGGNVGSIALASFGLGPLAGALQPQRELQAMFASRLADGDLFILDEHGRDRFAVGGGIVPNQLVVSCGAWPTISPLLGPRARARPVPDADAAGRELDAFCAVAAAAINAAYRRAGAAPPDMDIGLRPPALATAEPRLPSAPGGAPSAASARSLTGRALATVAAEVAAPASAFVEVGGQEQAKRELEALCLAIRDPGVYTSWGIRPPKGVLLHGPPGTGKTLLARCVATEANATFFHIRVTDVTSRWYGDSERRLQQAFTSARREAPAILFFDEIDALAPDRDGAHEATQRTLSTLLENMDGLEEGRGVVVLAATNRPAAVDSALTRPGRFDKLIEVPLPDRTGRRSIFGVHMRKAEAQAGRALFEAPGDDAWERLLDATEGRNGAEIAEIVRRSLEAKVRSGARGGLVTAEDLVAVAHDLERRW